MPICQNGRKLCLPGKASPPCIRILMSQEGRRSTRGTRRDSCRVPLHCRLGKPEDKTSCNDVMSEDFCHVSHSTLSAIIE